jgi:hypothetical protein
MTAFKLKAQTMDEDVAQQLLVEWMKWKKIPHIHIPNEGKRSFATFKWLENMGFKVGCSDLLVPRASQGFHGYWIEMKKQGKKPTENQIVFMEEMRAEGYKAEWFDDWEKARKSVEDYLT